VLLSCGDPELIRAQFFNGQSLKILGPAVHQERDVQIAGAKRAKHVLRRHHAKLHTYVRICALERPEGREGVQQWRSAFGDGKGSAKMPEEEVCKIEIAYPRPFAAPPGLEALVCAGS
jgi:hypothetical protein